MVDWLARYVRQSRVRKQHSHDAVRVARYLVPVDVKNARVARSFGPVPLFVPVPLTSRVRYLRRHLGDPPPQGNVVFGRFVEARLESEVVFLWWERQQSNNIGSGVCRG